MKNLEFEIHRYAPELTKAFWNGIQLDIEIDYMDQKSGKKSDLVRAVRNHRLFSNKIKNFRYAKVRKEYEDEIHLSLNKTIQGSFNTIKSVSDVIDKFYSPESDIIDGTKLPEPKIYVAFGKNGKLRDVTALARSRYENGKSAKTRK